MSYLCHRLSHRRERAKQLDAEEGSSGKTHSSHNLASNESIVHSASLTSLSCCSAIWSTSCTPCRLAANQSKWLRHFILATLAAPSRPIQPHLNRYEDAMQLEIELVVFRANVYMEMNPRHVLL